MLNNLQRKLRALTFLVIALNAWPQQKAVLDLAHRYTLAELIDIAEHNNPRTRILWERAKQSADRLGIARSAYYPVLVGAAAFSDERIINPFPKPLAPLGYTMVEIPQVQPEVKLNYLLFDFGRRGARVDAAVARQIAAGANFDQTNQDVAFRVAQSYYGLVTAEERLKAAEETLKTARTTQDAAEAQLANGRSTLPDVLNARAETAQATFDRESADGDQKIARVNLTESLGVEPSPDIIIDNQESSELPDQLTTPVNELIERAMKDRPDLAAQVAEIRASDDEILAARAAYRPTINISATGAETSIWPTSSYGTLGSASKPTWSAAVSVDWKLFDGGARRNELAEAESKQREAKDELTEKRDAAARQVWTSYISFRTALRKEDAAVALLSSANSSYSASLDAYNYGVKNLIDVVTAEKQLAQARLSSVSARSQLFVEAVRLEFVIGNLLRNAPRPPRREEKNDACAFHRYLGLFFSGLDGMSHHCGDLVLPGAVSLTALETGNRSRAAGSLLPVRIDLSDGSVVVDFISLIGVRTWSGNVWAGSSAS